MRLIDHVREIIYQGNIDSIKKRHLYLAYLALHMDNPCLHPDDHLSDQGGYQGWMVLLTNKVLTSGTGKLRDDFHYPTAFLKIGQVLEELDWYHEDLIDSAKDEAEEAIATDLMGCLNSLSRFMEEMKPSELDEAVDSAQKLYLHHASESNSAEEEEDTHAGTLKDVADVLNWLQQFSK